MSYTSIASHLITKYKNLYYKVCCQSTVHTNLRWAF